MRFAAKMEDKNMCDKKVLFISHAEKDIDIVEKFVDLLYDMGIRAESMLCSSISEIGIPIREDIYEYLRNSIDSDRVIPIFMLSDNYYSSVACLNEMGAVWVKQKDYYVFLLPDFEFSKIKGAINPNKKGILLQYKSERELRNLKEDLNQFCEEICHTFHIEKSRRWERKRDDFIATIQKTSIEMTDIVIDLKECEGFCIGEDENDGCTSIFDKVKNKIVTKIDFRKTNANICSAVIYTGHLNVRNQYDNNRYLIFDLKASDTICDIELECRLKSRNVRRAIKVTSEWENYRVPLNEFGADLSEWEDLKEIKFLLKRKTTSGGELEIRSMMIK